MEQDAQSLSIDQYLKAFELCREIYSKKVQDYGTSWRILRTVSVTDQMFIKAQRLRTLQELGHSKVDESPQDAFQAIVNYGVIALIQLELGYEDEDLKLEDALDFYDKHAKEITDLMQAKNHDYGEAWRDMRIESMTDLILMKLLRVKKIESNQGRTLISEGLASNFQDMVNYALFALILLSEQKEN
jgi:hypothetical protein